MCWKHRVFLTNTVINSCLYGCRNIDRFPRSKEPLPDTVVLSKSTYGGFYRDCPPMICRLYMSAQKRKKIITIQDSKTLSYFLGTIDNKFDAYLWFKLSYSEWIKHGSVKYKIVENGFLFTIQPDYVTDIYYSDRWSETDFFDTYFIGFDKKIIKVRTKEIVTYLHHKKTIPIEFIPDSTLSYEWIKSSKTKFKSFKSPSFYNDTSGTKMFRRYLQRNLEYDPEIEIVKGTIQGRDSIEGIVSVRFIVESDGSISDISILY